MDSNLLDTKSDEFFFNAVENRDNCTARDAPKLRRALMEVELVVDTIHTVYENTYSP